MAQSRRRLIVPEVPGYNSFTFGFHQKQLNDDFDTFLSSTKIHSGTLQGMLIYNILAFPAFFYYHYYQCVVLNESYIAMPLVFLFNVFMVHVSFFALYYFEHKKTNDEEERRVNAKRREWTMNVYIIVSLSACGMVMVAELPQHQFFYKYVDGNIPVEPFIISLLISVHTHSLLPIHWGAIMSASFVQLLLIIYSWYSTAMRQTFVTNSVLIVLYIAVVFVNKIIHESKIKAFLVDRANKEKLKVESSYLDQPTKSSCTNKIAEDHDETASTAVSFSSDAVSSLTGYHNANDDLSAITFASFHHLRRDDEVKLRSRPGNHLAKEKSLF